MIQEITFFGCTCAEKFAENIYYPVKNSSRLKQKQIYLGFDVRGQQGIYFSTGEHFLMDYLLLIVIVGHKHAAFYVNL